MWIEHVGFLKIAVKGPQGSMGDWPALEILIESRVIGTLEDKKIFRYLAPHPTFAPLGKMAKN